ncbi:MAG: hypothetical protein K8R23_20635 [Chthoniobacter sp.]|nr:hypothetical protein [Chthoniobacter sp.]
MSAPDDHPRSLGRFATRIFWTVLGLAVAYILSIGPVSVIVLRFCWALPGDPPAVAAKREARLKAIEAFYSPLKPIAEGSKTGPLIELYSDWWRYTFQPKGGYGSSGLRIIYDSPTSSKLVPDLPPSAPDPSPPPPEFSFP